MKLSLQIKMGQQLTMTPQLQQAIRLLQLSTLDLQQEIQEALDSNPLLELEESSDSIDTSNTDIQLNGQSTDGESETDGINGTDSSEQMIDSDFSQGDNWEDQNIPSDYH